MEALDIKQLIINIGDLIVAISCVASLALSGQDIMIEMKTHKPVWAVYKAYLTLVFFITIGLLFHLNDPAYIAIVIILYIVALLGYVGVRTYERLQFTKTVHQILGSPLRKSVSTYSNELESLIGKYKDKEIDVQLQKLVDILNRICKSSNDSTYKLVQKFADEHLSRLYASLSCIYHMKTAGKSAKGKILTALESTCITVDRMSRCQNAYSKKPLPDDYEKATLAISNLLRAYMVEVL